MQNKIPMIRKWYETLFFKAKEHGLNSSFIFTLFMSGKALFQVNVYEITFFLKRTNFADNSASATKTVIQNNNKTMSIVSLI
jgi:hypothetical protein